MTSLLDTAKSCLVDETQPLDRFGELLGEQWAIKRSLTEVVSTPYIDEIYRKALNAGALGGKLLGAGGGGFMLFYADSKYHENQGRPIR